MNAWMHISRKQLFKKENLVVLTKVYFTSFAVSSCVSRSTRTAVASDFVGAGTAILARIGKTVVDI